MDEEEDCCPMKPLPGLTVSSLIEYLSHLDPTLPITLRNDHYVNYDNRFLPLTLEDIATEDGAVRIEFGILM